MIRTAALLLALAGAALAQQQPTSFVGRYAMTGSFDDGTRTRAQLTIRQVGGRLQLERDGDARWTADAAPVAADRSLVVLYRPGQPGIASALSGSTPRGLYLATYRFEQGQLTESIVNTNRLSGERWSTLEAVARRPLPANIKALRDRILTIAAANTTDKDSIPAVRAQLDPLLAELGRYYAQNRPVDEVALTRGAWKSLWYDDPDIDASERFAPLDRENIYQVIFDGYYYNVSNTTYRLFGVRLFSSHAYLKGNYTIADPASAATAGQPRRNVIDLEFAGNRLRLGKIPTDRTLLELVDRVENRRRRTIPIPGPRGITGELWNIYLDEDVRISLGVQDDNGVQDVYILRRTEKAGPLAPLR